MLNEKSKFRQASAFLEWTGCYETNKGVDLLQARGEFCHPGESSDRRDRRSAEPDLSDGEGDEPPSYGAGSPEGGQRPLPQQHHEEPGRETEGTAQPKRETAQGF